MPEDLEYFNSEDFKEILRQYEESVKSGERIYMDADELTDSYVEQGEAVLRMAKGIQLQDGTRAAFSAAVYTQTTDVETEVNGLMTYDRKVMKMDETRIRAINSAIAHSLDK